MVLLFLLLSCFIYFEELCCIFVMEEGKIKGLCLVFQMYLNGSGAWGCSIDLALRRNRW